MDLGTLIDKNYVALVQGFLSGAGLIIAIGAQNAFVLKQGLKKQHVFITALFCSLMDILLICVGVAGFGEMVNHYSFLVDIMKWGGILFLLWYGWRSFLSAFKSQSMDLENAEEINSLKKTLYCLIAFTLLNPHVYLDTVVLLGSISSQFEKNERLLFAIGAAVASFSWFFSLSYGSRFLAPLFKNRNTWKVIDVSIACIMWFIAISLFYTD